MFHQEDAYPFLPVDPLDNLENLRYQKGGKISGKLRNEGVHIMYVRPLMITPNPIVTIMTEIIGSPMSGLNMRRSTTIPRRNANTRVRIKAR